MKKNKLIELFLTYFKIGLFTFGGGYAMIPLIQHEMVENKKWISDEDILEIIAIAESTPGPIAINAATFIGYKVAGVLGSIFATLGVVLPSLIIITVISFILEAFKNAKIVSYAFWGIRAGVLALILKALYNMFKKAKKDTISWIIMAITFAVGVFTDINAVYIIIFSALFGLISSFFVKEGGCEK